MTAAHEIEAFFARCGSTVKLCDINRVSATTGPGVLVLSWSELCDTLPDHGLPCGVVELTAPRALGGSTSVALAAVGAGQARGDDAWAAWLDPEGTLHGPGVVAAGVDLTRMLVVRPPRTLLARVALKVTASGAFEVVVIDFAAVPFGATCESMPKLGIKPEVWVRKLALAAETTGTTVLLLTDVFRPRAVPWPVALRVELSRPRPNDLAVRITKDRRGRVGLAKTIGFRPVLKSAI